MNITFDIETIPSQSAEVKDLILASVSPPGQYKKPESIAEWMRENGEAEAESQWLKTSFDGGLGQIVCIGFAMNDSEPVSFGVEETSLAAEKDMLQTFFANLGSLYRSSGTRPVLIGHNHVNFDIPFIWKRAMIHGVRPPFWFPRDPKPWGENVFDTMTQWSGSKGSIKLDTLAKLFGLKGKDGMTGSDVWPAIKAGAFQSVAEYCRDDVELTRAIFRRMTFEVTP